MITPLYSKLLVFLLALTISENLSAQTKLQPQPAVYNQKLQPATLLFMENKGQVTDTKGNLRPDILFMANSGGAKIYLSSNAICYQFTKTEYPKGYDPFSKEPAKNLKKEEALKKQIKTSTHRFTVELQGANLHSTVSKQQQSSYFENYYLTQCPNGITGVHGYEKIIYKNVYPNIDWIIYSKGGFMEYDFLVHPGGDAATIKLKVKDADSVHINEAGELVMKTSLGEVREKAPVSYADGNVVSSRFKQNNDGTISFDVQPNPNKELVIDPSVVWSTYYGGVGNEGGGSSTVDNNDNIYLAGSTMALTSIASGGFQNTFGGGQFDAFLVKFSASGNRLWATYYGGNANDGINAIATDAGGNVFVAGATVSTNGIAFNGFQAAYAGGDEGFLVKFDSNGNRLWGTYYGGSGSEYVRGCNTDANGNVYIAGFTNSTSNIASGGFQNTFGGGVQFDAFLVKFSASGSRLWGTYYGGVGGDQGMSCHTDNTGFVYLSGSTSSDGLAYQGFKNTREGSTDNFLVKLTSGGSRVWATYYGGEGGESDGNCSTDPSGNVFLAGNTSSGTNISYNGYYSSYGGATDLYIVKFSGNGSRQWATYVGGAGNEMNPFISCNAAGNVYLSGTTTSTSRIFLNGLPNYNLQTAYYDAFITKFEAAGNCLWGTYYGGSDLDMGISCAPDNAGNIYLAGTTGSSGLGVNGFQNNFVGAPYDDFLVKIADEILCIAATVPNITVTPDTTCGNILSTLAVTSGNLNSATQWQWHKDSCNGAIVGTGTSIAVYPAATTTYYVRGEGGCATPGSCTSKTITVNPYITSSVSLTASPSGAITSGTLVTFTATPVNGGIAPTYNFRVNGIAVQTSNNNFYTSNTLSNGDVVEVIMAGNAPCLNNSLAFSNGIVMIVTVPCIGPSIPIISTTATAICSGTSATISIATGSLNSAAQWTWHKDSCNGPIAGTGTIISVSPTVTTTYYVRGEGGCVTSGACASITITVNNTPLVSFTATPSSICSGDTVIVTFTGNAATTANYVWNWSGGNVISGSNAGPYSIVYNNNGTINLSVNNGSCAAIAATQTITVQPVTLVSFNVNDSTGCDTLIVNFTNTSPPGSGIGYRWDFGDGSSSIDLSPPPHFYTNGSYKVILADLLGRCSKTYTRTIRVATSPIASFSVSPVNNTPVQLSQATFSFTNTSQNATRYVWRFTNADSIITQNAFYKFTSIGTYAVSLYAYNNAGCADTFTMKPFIIVADSALLIPNAFSPNNDGINDTWKINGLQGDAKSNVSIFNRWGQSVFNSTGYNKPWDGNYNGKPLPVDTYYYIITANDKRFSGSVFLLR